MKDLKSLLEFVYDLKSLLEFVYDLHVRKERRMAMDKDFKGYEASLIQDANSRVKLIESVRYGYSSLNWCFITQNLIQNSSFTNCRDYINESLQASITDGAHSYYPRHAYPQIATDRLRIMFAGGDDKFFENAIRTTNIYAKLAGWELTSYIKMPVKDCNWSVYVVSGDKNWIRYPQLLSIFILIIRYVHRIKELTPDYINDAYSLEAHWEESVEYQIALHGLSDMPYDVRFMNRLYKYLIPLFIHEKEIFDKAMPDAWTGHIFSGDSGIHSFIEGKGAKDHREESKRLNNFYEAEVAEYERKASEMYDRD